MKVSCDWNPEALKEIAKACDNRQLVRDVGYASFCCYHNPASIYVEYTEDAFIIGQFQKSAFRIIGMGTKVSARGRGLASLLLQRAESEAKRRGAAKIKTRTKSGAEFYARRGYDITGERGGDYLMEKAL